MTGRWRWPLRIVALGYLGFLVVLPVGSVFYRAFQHGFGAAWDAVTTPDAVHALWLTFLVVLIAVPADTVFGVGVALILARHRFPGAWLLDAFVDLPLAISPVVVGIALILVYGKTGWFGNWLAAHGITIIFSLPGIVMASATVALPYVVREVLPGPPGDRHRPGAGGHHARGLPLHHLPPHHPPLHPPEPGLRRDPDHGPGASASSVRWRWCPGLVAGKTETMTLFIQDGVENLDLVAAYAGAVILALVALGVLAVVGADRSEPTRERRKPRWRSRSDPSPSDSELPLLSTT